MTTPRSRRHGGKWSLASFISSALLISSLFHQSVEAGVLRRKKRVNRVKAGTVYEQHDPVHIVVNKIG